MRTMLVIFTLAILGSVAASLDRDAPAKIPNQFVIGRHTFFDFGPPNDYYEILFVNPRASGSEIERFLLTPAVDVCVRPATVEFASGSLAESPAELLGTANPCSIPEKELNQELKRCKDCLVFSGANVAMQLKCGGKSRIIRSDILDRDMFDAHADTPANTSWTMRLLTRLDETLSPGVMQKRMIEIPQEDNSAGQFQGASTARLALSSGEYDALFQGAPDKPSELYRASQIHYTPPSVRLISSEPIAPSDAVLPKYPPFFALAHLEGTVTFSVTLDSAGGVRDFLCSSGPAPLCSIMKESVANWRFPESAFNQRNQSKVQFNLNCPPKKK